MEIKIFIWVANHAYQKNLFSPFGEKPLEYLKGRNFYNFNKDEYIVRLHIGLEDPKDLINDLKQGLKKIK